MKTLHGNYIQIGDETYQLMWVASSTEQQVAERQPQIDLLRRGIGNLHQLSLHLSKAVDEGTSAFQHIAIANYREIALGMSNAMILLRAGSLADSLTLLRPVLEYILDIAYLGMWPNEVASYERKVQEHNAKLINGEPISRDPNLRMRFINIKTMTEKILANPDCSDITKGIVNQFNLLSNVAEHTSPERKNLSLRRPRDWENVVGQFELAVFYAINQIDCVDAGLSSIIMSDRELFAEFEQLREALYSTMSYEGHQ